MAASNAIHNNYLATKARAETSGDDEEEEVQTGAHVRDYFRPITEDATTEDTGRVKPPVPAKSAALRNALAARGPPQERQEIRTQGVGRATAERLEYIQNVTQGYPKSSLAVRAQSPVTIRTNQAGFDGIGTFEGDCDDYMRVGKAAYKILVKPEQREPVVRDIAECEKRR